ncbi:CPBP family intramembrane glutamic endopeptidase [Seonamhaeicola marinus]|uniref:CPBP family intramembrane metalloprotease n=1 Tax=Seonamhaeicola marinus TaxID=1912246 RepID=A0A5D0HTZ3_9FLAO|nr:CPBP family intramembrane glutamic endopeptidase [Seonamhaeicola marinus]TYA73929.1 CPBP family intramembrane metalloprotease [Seonamhaeicola marinus]
MKNENILNNKQISLSACFLDLIIYLSILFLAREIYIESLGLIASVLIGSFIALGIATWRMKTHHISWIDLGLKKPKSWKRTIVIALLIILTCVLSIILIEILKEIFPNMFSWESVNLNRKHKGPRFGNLKGNYALFFSIIFFIWVESALEELIDRGFLMNWLERLFSKTPFPAFLAITVQAALFGYRHSYDLSERSITVGILGFIMGLAYVYCGRNLWALIIAHCVLNSFSMLDRVI